MATLMRLRLLATLTLTLFLSACVPATFTVVPEIKGRVLDSAGEPVPGAHVDVRALPEGARKFSLTCDESGRFYRGEEAQWGLYIFPMDNFGRQYEAVSVVNGQSSNTKKFGTTWSHIRFLGLGTVQTADLGDLRLTSAAKPP
jgi:hypothetical protein